MSSISASRAADAKWRRNVRRLTRHYLPLSLVTALIIAYFVKTLPGEDIVQKWSMATAYAGLALLGYTLLVGVVLYAFRARPSPTSTDLRRDAGILGALIMFAHVGFGLFVHMGNPLLYFLFPANEEHLIPLRYDPFGLANWLGLFGTLILVALFATSNDLSLRVLGQKNWKTLQRANYFLFAFVALHGIAYQLLEKRTLPLIVLFGWMIGIVTILQFAGFFIRRKLKKQSN